MCYNLWSMRIMNHINVKELSDYYYSKLIDKLNNYPEVGVWSWIWSNKRFIR